MWHKHVGSQHLWFLFAVQVILLSLCRFGLDADKQTMRRTEGSTAFIKTQSENHHVFTFINNGGHTERHLLCGDPLIDWKLAAELPTEANHRNTLGTRLRPLDSDTVLLKITPEVFENAADFLPSSSAECSFASVPFQTTWSREQLLSAIWWYCKPKRLEPSLKRVRLDPEPTSEAERDRALLRWRGR